MTTPETTPPAGTAMSPVEAIDRALVVLEALARGGAQGVQLADLATELWGSTRRPCTALSRR